MRLAMHSVTDLLAYSKKLQDAGEPEPITKVHVEMLASLIENNLPSKKDLKDEVSKLETKIEHETSRLEMKLASETSRLEAKIDYVSTRLEEKIEHVQTRLEEKITATNNALDVKFTGKFNTLHWMFGFLLTGVLALLIKAY